MQLLYEYAIVRDLRGNAVNGVMEKHAALEALLRNTGLKAIFSSADAATIRPASAPQAGHASKSPIPYTNENDSEGRTDVPPANQLAMITVTATRVATPEQLAPVAISVYTGGQLETAGVYNLTSLQSIDPSINITQGTGEPYIAIRGVTSSNTTEVGNPAVSLAQNGFFVNRAYDIDAAFYDVQRIEVLKGPQGTLFGRNSTAGVINIIDVKPQKTFGGYLNLQGGDYSLFGAEGAINLPIASHLFARVSGLFRSRAGYLHVTGPGLNYWGDDDRSASGRAQILWEPTENFSLLLGYQIDHLGGYGDVQVSTPLGTAFNPALIANGITNYAPSALSLAAHRTTWVATLRNLPLDAKLVYNGGIDVEQYHHASDVSTPPTPPSLVPTVAQFIQNEHPTTWNHQLLLSVPIDSRVHLILGGFYFSERNTPVDSFQLEESGQYAGQDLIQFDYSVNTVSKAAFGQVAYNVTRSIQLTGGARYTHESIARYGANYLRCDIAGVPPFLYGALGCVGVPPLNVTSATGSVAESKPTYHLGMQWNITKRNMVYVKYDTGFKSGGFNVNPGAPTVPYGPETVESYELGSKNTLFEQRAIIDADIFDERYLGYQANVPTPLISPSSSGIENFGTAHMIGAELSLEAIIAERTLFDLGATYLHDRFGGNLPPVVGPLNTPVNVSGNQLPNAPALVATANLSHKFKFDAYTLTVRLDAKFSSKFYFDLYNLPITSSPSYARGDALLAFGPKAGDWKVRFSVHNISNSYVVSQAAIDPFSNTNTYEFLPPRTFVGEVDFRF